MVYFVSTSLLRGEVTLIIGCPRKRGNLRDIYWGDSPNYPDYNGGGGDDQITIEMDEEGDYDFPDPEDNGFEWKTKCYKVGTETWSGMTTSFDRWRWAGVGLLAGVMASSSTELPKENTRIADFSGICAPWSRSSWTKNFRHLHMAFKASWEYWKGTHHSGEKQSEYWTGVNGTLAKVLSRVFEIRVDEEREGQQRYVRPPSFKMCPPNTYLYGIGYYAKSNSDSVMRGIRYLRCHEPNGTQNRNEEGYKVYTSPTDPELNGEYFDGYSMRGLFFSLEQRLGKVDRDYVDAPVQEVNCKSTEQDLGKEMFAAGYHIKRDPETRIREFHLGCVPSPY